MIKFTSKAVRAALVAAGVSMLSMSASAMQVSSCSTSVLLTKMTRADLSNPSSVPGGVIDFTGLEGGGLRADRCWKLDNNDVPLPTSNFGQFDDGLLNGELSKASPTGFDYLKFLAGRPLINAEQTKDGAADDPGWIYVGKSDATTPTITSPLTGATKSISEFLRFATTGVGNTSGTWDLDLNPNVVSLVQSFLGTSYFDSFAIVLKAAKGFVLYDFDFSDGVDLPAGFPVSPAVLAELLTKPYDLTGTWDTGDLGGKELSHFSAYVRDPQEMGASVAEPGSLALVGLSLAGLAFASRRRRNS